MQTAMADLFTNPAHIVRNRRLEDKYIIDLPRACHLIRALPRFLAPVAYDGRAEHINRTVILDTHCGELGKRLVGGETCIKLRVRSYHTRHDEGQANHLWFEAKGRDDGMTLKRRRRVTRDALAPLLDESALRPAFAIEYVRRSFENSDGTIRVTVDRDLRTCLVSENHYKSDLELAAPGVPLAAHSIVEVKRIDGRQLPTALASLLEILGEPQRFSKARTAARFHWAQ